MDNNIAPIIIFAYNRSKELQQTFEALLQCVGIENHEIFVFCDGPKNENDNRKTEEVLIFLKKIQKQKKIYIFQSNINKGLANSVIAGVSQIFETYNSVIVLEDDLIVAPNFLTYMNQALTFYQNESKIFSVSGYSPKIDIPNNYQQDVYFTPRATSWGWATWKNRWETVDWEMKTYLKFKYNFIAQWQFAKGGIDLPGMLKDQMNGRINSWAIRLVYQQFLLNQVTVYPTISKVINIGIGKEATNTKKTRRFDTSLDDGLQTRFEFQKFKSYNPKVLNAFRNVFSIWNRILDRFYKY